jgi:hypothetical protein
MRGLFIALFVAVLAAPAFGQATGEVHDIGFNGTFRSTGWTSMVVWVTPTTNEAGAYEIRVFQHDLDGDRPVYVHPISLSGLNTSKLQKFWMYFQTQPIHNGLGYNNATLKDLQKDLSVYLTTPGGKQIVAKLPLTSTVTDIDPVKDSSGGSTKGRGTRLILVVSAAGNQIQIDPYSNATGVTEDVEAVPVRPGALPDNPIGYEGVDGIIWLDGNPTDLSANGSETFAAIQDYVRFGGHLVVCQSVNNFQEDAGFGEMMPVDVSSIGIKKNFEPLRSMAVPPPVDKNDTAITPDWADATGPFQMARAKARPGATVDTWIDWKEDGSNLDVSPFLVRRPFGLGQVTWVAMPMQADSRLSSATGWPYVWDRIFGWSNDAFVLPSGENPDQDRVKRYHASSAIDLGYPMIQGLNLSSKGAWLIFLAVVFFLVYWAVAGPGSYIFLAVKKKRGLSWFAFGATALLATAVTYGVVSLVLRGPPEIKHVSFVRGAVGQPTIVTSRFGLYIPRDGDQTMVMPGSISSSVSYLAPMPEHPQQLHDVSEFSVPLDYEVPVREMKMETDPQLTVPYRSSLKKFQARWVGNMPYSIGGSVRLDLDPKSASLPLAGSLTNYTGVDLTDVYLVFNKEGRHDWMVYVPKWAKGTSLDIHRDLANPYRIGTDPNNSMETVPRNGKIISSELAPDTDQRMPAASFGYGWANYWFSQYRHIASASTPDVDEPDPNFYFPALSVFSRLPPVPNQKTMTGFRANTPGWSSDRVELLNRGARELDAGDAIGAGNLLVIGSASGPLPIELRVNGSKVGGDGMTFYQYVLPIDRGPLLMPTTHPSPATKPAGGRSPA